MKKTMKWTLAVVLVLLCGVLLWRWGYDHAKRLDNIPSLTLVEEHGADFAQEKLKGYEREQVLAIWGEPDGMLSGMFGDIWDLPSGQRYVLLYYTGEGQVEEVRIGEREK